MNTEKDDLILRCKEDMNIYAKKFDIEKMHITQIAISWIEEKVEDIGDLKEFLEQIEKLLDSEEFEKAMSSETDQEAAEIIKELRRSEYYKKISEKTGYRIIEEFEFPETYKEKSLKQYKESSLELCEYIKRNMKELKEIAKER